MSLKGTGAPLVMKSERLTYEEFSEQEIAICASLVTAHSSGALYWPAEDVLLVADLHFEKGSSFAARGVMLPPYDTKATLERLAAVLDRYDPRTVICLGDSFHDRDAASRMSDHDLETLHILQEGREWIWLTGNHDPEISQRLGGERFAELKVSGLTLRHEPRSGPVTHEIAGHLHPAAFVSLHGHTFRRPCFVSNGTRLVMPAFGAFTGGLNVLDDAFAPLFGNNGMQVWLLGQEGVYPVAPRLLKED